MLIAPKWPCGTLKKWFSGEVLKVTYQKMRKNVGIIIGWDWVVEVVGLLAWPAVHKISCWDCVLLYCVVLHNFGYAVLFSQINFNSPYLFLGPTFSISQRRAASPSGSFLLFPTQPDYI